MRSIANLFAAFGNLAGALNALADVVNSASGRLRAQLEGDGGPALIEHAAAEEEPAAAGKRGRGGK